MIGQLAAAVRRGRELAVSDAETRARGGATRGLGAGPCGAGLWSRPCACALVLPLSPR